MRAFVSLACASLLALAIVGGVSATPSDRTFHGTWHTAEWAGCDVFGIPDGEYSARGTWNVTLFANEVDAQVGWNLWDATGHYSFGGNKLGANWIQESVGSGPSFVLDQSVLYPGTFTLYANGDVEVTFAYGVFDPGCTSTTYGELVH